jgi:hypothetical protein
VASGRGDLLFKKEHRSMSSLSILSQKFNLEDCRLITVSDIVVDADGKYLRTIRFYGDPVTNGAPTIFTEVVCRTANETELEIQAPGYKF